MESDRRMALCPGPGTSTSSRVVGKLKDKEP